MMAEILRNAPADKKVRIIDQCCTKKLRKVRISARVGQKNPNASRYIHAKKMKLTK